MIFKQIIFLIVVLIIGGLIGFFVGKSGQSGQKTSMSSSTPQQTSQTDQSKLFRSQTATFQGEITKVNKDSLDVKSDSGQAGSLTLSDKVVIYKFKTGSTQATASADLNSIETGKKVLIVLELSGSQYKVVSISYQPPPVAPTRVTPTKATPTKKK